MPETEVTMWNLDCGRLTWTGGSELENSRTMSSVGSNPTLSATWSSTGHPRLKKWGPTTAMRWVRNDGGRVKYASVV